MKGKIQKIGRWILTILLLWQVWTHSHWSVALSLTLVFITVELETERWKIIIGGLK